MGCPVYIRGERFHTDSALSGSENYLVPFILTFPFKRFVGSPLLIPTSPSTSPSIESFGFFVVVLLVFGQNSTFHVLYNLFVNDIINYYQLNLN